MKGLCNLLNKLLRYKLILFPVAVLVFVLAVILIISALLPKTCPVNSEVTVEAGNTEFISVNLFRSEPETEIELLTDVSKIDLNKTGSYALEFSASGESYISYINIVDTTPPTATAVDCEIYNDETLTAADFVTDIKDCSEVAAEFVTTPDFTAVGEHTVNIRLKDAAKNEALLSARLKVKTDTTPPEIKGMSTISVRIGNSISYRNGVTVTDNRDETVKYSFDSSSVNLQKEGTYTVTYTATDAAGNTATAERTVKVLPKLVINEEYVKGLAQKVLDKIITDNMTPHQKVDKIFKWMRNNITYASSPETDLVNAAYVGFTNKRGDCFNYYSMTKLLLDGCGIQNMKVDRYGSSSTHYWHLVNVGTGWYHYDTTPQSLADPYRCFMKTDAQVWAYAKSRSDGRTDYYNFDTSKYPERATKNYTY